jgi:hypothetical protein
MYHLYSSQKEKAMDPQAASGAVATAVAAFQGQDSSLLAKNNPHNYSKSRTSTATSSSREDDDFGIFLQKQCSGLRSTSTSRGKQELGMIPSPPPSSSSACHQSSSLQEDYSSQQPSVYNQVTRQWRRESEPATPYAVRVVVLENGPPQQQLLQLQLQDDDTSTYSSLTPAPPAVVRVVLEHNAHFQQEEQSTYSSLTPAPPPPTLTQSMEINRPGSANTRPGAVHMPGNHLRMVSNDTAITMALTEDDNDMSPPHPVTQAMVVAAQLSTDLEAQLEAQVRQRIYQEATQAQVVTTVDYYGMTNHKQVSIGVNENNTSDNSQEEPTEDSKEDQEEAKRIAAFKELHKPRGVKEKIWGSLKVQVKVNVAATPECIRKRELLSWTVKRNPIGTATPTDLWVTSVTTNQKAWQVNDIPELQRSVCNFSAISDKQALEIGLANATPRMLPFDEHPICHVCHSKFALLKRPCHCRNCGICICSSCATMWSSKRIPETYNTKNESQVKVCLACDWLSTSFREALVEGRYQHALDLYATGNINLQSPFASVEKSGEVL